MSASPALSDPVVDVPQTAPTLVARVELAAALPALAAGRAGREPYREALVLARLHGEPLGTVLLPLPTGGLAPGELAAGLWDRLGAQIDAHVRADGLPELARLGAGGVPQHRTTRCDEERAAVVRDAPPLTVIVPTRDRPETLARCLRSVLAADYPADRLELIVVDNAPATGATAELLRREFPGVRHVREDEPGLSVARNAGLRAASGELIAFTDDDVVVDRGWLLGLAGGFRAATDVACVTGLVLPLELETAPQVWFEQYKGPGTGLARRVYDLRAHRPDDPLFPYTAGRLGPGGNCAFRTATLRALGGCDPALGAGTIAPGGEDLDLFFRTVRGDHRIVYEPRAIVLHENRGDYDAFRAQLHAYGVGLTAFLTKALATDLREAPAFLRALPRGVALALGPGSEKHAGKGADYPREVWREELRGMARGPLAYARSRRAVRRRRAAARRAWGALKS